MIGGTTTEEARVAIGLLLHDGATRGDGSGAERIGGTENRDDWQTNGSGDVHRSGIVAQKQVALRKQAGEIGDGGFAGQVDGLATHVGDDGVGDGRLGGGAEEDDVSVVVRQKAIGPFGEALGWPTFCGTVRSARADGDAASVWACASVDQDLRGVDPGRIGNSQIDMVDLRQGVEPAGATNEFEVVKLFVRRNFAGLGYGDGFGE